QTNGSADDTLANKWKLAEPLNGNGIRNMKDPTLFGDPDRIFSANFYTGGSGDGDQASVHGNSGVNNKAAYLMVDGDTFNGFTITGIGITKTAAIYYNTQTTKLWQGADYRDLYNSLNQSCTELIGGAAGITAADCQQVLKATQATEMNLEHPAAAATAAVCVTNSPVYVFNDGLESGSGNWTTGTTSGVNVWTAASTKNPLVGLRSNNGYNDDAISSSFVAMNASVAIPANAFLHFTHRFQFEYDGGSYYDGGIIEYSTNNGASWTQLTSATFYQAGINYGGTLAGGGGNPQQGKSAFVARSGAGLGSTRYTLASLSGQNVRFRWIVGSDVTIGSEGWRIDDVKIYTCAVVPTDTPTATATATKTSTPTSTPTATTVPPTSTSTLTPTPTGTGDNSTSTPTQETATPTDTPSTPVDTPTPTDTGTGALDLLTNGSFEDDADTDKIPDGWTLKNPSGDKQKCNKPGSPPVALDGECWFQFKGKPFENAKLIQNPDPSALIAGDTITLGGSYIAKGSVLNKVKVRVVYVDTSIPTGKITVKLTAPASAWTTLTGTLDLTLAGEPSVIKVMLQNKGTSGKVRFDAMSLLVNVAPRLSVIGLP
ncbi:MAG TPA: M4 family metallopeptidase, partial [Phototrophicaceae bacterium]|nr:M4 family metallopeptidase [Phototrophicaceae bacterium]